MDLELTPVYRRSSTPFFDLNMMKCPRQIIKKKEGETKRKEKAIGNKQMRV
jgi:hypothetical protein